MVSPSNYAHAYVIINDKNKKKTFLESIFDDAPQENLKKTFIQQFKHKRNKYLDIIVLVILLFFLRNSKFKIIQHY